MSADSDIASHPEPAWRGKANFMIFGDLSGGGMPGRLEQLWANQIDDTTFEICCIPFFMYGIALGDHVRVGAAFGRRYVVNATTMKSGRRVLRVWLGAATGQARQHVADYLERSRALHEWSSANLVAIDIAPEASDSDVRLFIEGVRAEAAQVEWGG